jgi:hypothetical protein
VDSRWPRSLVCGVAKVVGVMLNMTVEAESSHLLLQYLLSSNFDVQSEEYATLVKKVLEALKKGGEIAVDAGRTGRAEAASRM